MLRMLLGVLIWLMILAGTAVAGELVITPEGYNRFNPVHLKEDGKGNLWTAYYDLKGKIHIKNITADRDLVVNEQAKQEAAGLCFHVQGDHAFAVWREVHGGARRLYLRATHDGGETLSDPILIDEKTRSFTRIKMGSNEQGEVFILWYGEKGGNKYHFYSVYSNDFGKTFSEPRNMTEDYKESIYPTLLVDEKGAHMFSYSIKGRELLMITRKTIDGGKTWTDPLEIKEIGVVTLFIEPIRVENRLHVFWYNGYEDFYVIESAYSDDEGKTWKTKTLDDTRGLEMEVMKVASDSAGNIYLALSGHRYIGEKMKVYIMRSADNGETWGEPIPLRHYPFEHTHAKSPAIHAHDSGEVVVVWVDFRNIRSNLYMQYSKDFGTTWLEKDVPLEGPGRFNTRIYPYTDTILKAGDRYYLLAYRFRGDYIMKAADLLLLDFKPEEAVQ